MALSGNCDALLLACIVARMSEGAKQIRILVADDFAEWRVQVRSILQRRPEWQVVEAHDGLQAVQKAIELHPDIVLLDIAMPFLNGIEAAKRIRKGSPGSRLIFLTQDNDAEVRAAALATSAERYLLKSSAGNELLPAMVGLRAV